MPQIERRQDVTVIVMDAVYEALDQEKLRQARDLLLHHAESVEPPLVVLDLSGTTYMGSAFIEVMFRTWKRVHGRNGRLVLCGVQPLCHEVLRDPFGYNARLVRGCRRSSRGNTCHINVARTAARFRFSAKKNRTQQLRSVVE